VIGVREDGRRLFTFARLPPSQWRSARTTNAIERLHEEFKRRIKTQTVLPSADTAAMLFWGLLACPAKTLLSQTSRNAFSGRRFVNVVRWAGDQGEAWNQVGETVFGHH